VNALIEEKQVLANDKEMGPGSKSVRRFTPQNEFWKFFGLLLAARLEGRTGTLWDGQSQEEGKLLQVHVANLVPRDTSLHGLCFCRQDL